MGRAWEERWDRAWQQRDEKRDRDTDGKKHLSRNTDMGQGQGDATEYRDRVGTEMEQGTRTQEWDLQDFLLTRDLLRSLLGQGRGLAL